MYTHHSPTLIQPPLNLSISFILLCVSISLWNWLQKPHTKVLMALHYTTRYWQCLLWWQKRVFFYNIDARLMLLWQNPFLIKMQFFMWEKFSLCCSFFSRLWFFILLFFSFLAGIKRDFHLSHRFYLENWKGNVLWLGKVQFFSFWSFLSLLCILQSH
jgi:hypothetical protein